jgi:hypothetical protein
VGVAGGGACHQAPHPPCCHPHPQPLLLLLLLLLLMMMMMMMMSQRHSL